MGFTLPLGRIFGARVGLNWSVFVMAWLLAWSLATYTFVDDAPGHTSAAYWVAALLAATGFVAGILAHELGHVAMARRCGVQTEEITLWMFGGVAKLRSLGRSPAAELRIALAGPAVSLVIAATALSTASIVRASDQLVASAVEWLGVINVSLAVFNLLPAAPLDGGRVLSAVLWRRWGDESRAHMASARVGRGLGSAMVLLGLFTLLVGGAAGGLWFAFLGWFLLSAADAEIALRSMQSLLGDRTIAEVMSRSPVTLDERATLGQAYDLIISRWRHAAYPVVDATGSTTGLFTLRLLSDVPRVDWERRRVGDLARPLSDVAVAQADEPLGDAIPRALGSPNDRLLVFSGAHLVGIVAPSDIARLLELLTMSAPRQRSRL